MKISLKIPFQASIDFESNHIQVVGSKKLLVKIHQFQNEQGQDPKKWTLITTPQTNEEILINEFIQKLNDIPLVYNHDELCHCRMVKTELVCAAIKSGCRSLSDVSRTTLAGTGCGSCRKDIEALLQSLTH